MLTYRLLTVKDVPFDAFPTYRNGGPAKVVVTGASTSYTTGGGQPGARLSAYVGREGGAPGEPHPLNGTRYPSVEDAERAAYDAGLTAFMVYDRDAHKWPVPA